MISDTPLGVSQLCRPTHIGYLYYSNVESIRLIQITITGILYRTLECAVKLSFIDIKKFALHIEATSSGLFFYCHKNNDPLCVLIYVTYKILITKNRRSKATIN
jgi:hypothetical protein